MSPVTQKCQISVHNLESSFRSHQGTCIRTFTEAFLQYKILQFPHQQNKYIQCSIFIQYMKKKHTMAINFNTSIPQKQSVEKAGPEQTLNVQLHSFQKQV